MSNQYSLFEVSQISFLMPFIDSSNASQIRIGGVDPINFSPLTFLTLTQTSLSLSSGNIDIISSSASEQILNTGYIYTSTSSISLGVSTVMLVSFSSEVAAYPSVTPSSIDVQYQLKSSGTTIFNLNCTCFSQENSTIAYTLQDVFPNYLSLLSLVGFYE